MTESLFPSSARLRRLRSSKALRELVRENSLSMDDLIYPVFVCDGKGRREPISSMPGVERVSLDQYQQDLERYRKLGIKALLIFGIPNHKDATGSSALDAEGCVQSAIRMTKELTPEIVVMSDVCLCEFTDHGHCGVISCGSVSNDQTLELLAKMAVSHAKAGADLVAPSSMMDGQVAAIRQALDAEGFSHLPVMAYSAKFSSAFYGPFREAAQSAPQFGDRKAYQMDAANGKEAMEEIRTDIEQGADIVMVKPGLAYLDVLARAADNFNKPLAVYNVSGEYSMVKAAAAAGFIDEKAVALEMLLAFKRAGAKLIITYFAPQAAEWLKV